MRSALQSSLLFVGLSSSFAVVALPGERMAWAKDDQAPELHWSPCGESYPGIECAVFRVPVDYDSPSGETTTLQLARVPGANADTTLFVNPGGPGGSGVDMVIAAGAVLSDAFQGRFDIVGFDPRGVASSEPLRCFDGEEEFLEHFGDTPPWFTYAPAEERAYFDAWSGIAEACADQRLYNHMSTADVARDLDGLRAAVGDERLSYLGFSYGSFLGNTYANLFPDQVGAVVLDGVLNPALWSNALTEVVMDAPAMRDELEELLRACDEARSECALSGEGEAALRYDIIESALWDAPLELREDDSYYYDQLLWNTREALYDPEADWGGPEGVGALLGALYDVVLAEPGAGERAADIRDALWLRWTPPPPFAGEDYPIDAFLGTACNDAEHPEAFEDYSNLGLAIDAVSVLAVDWWWSRAGCARWPVSSDRHAGPWTAETAAPVLIVGNYFDGITGYAGAVATSQWLANSRLLSYAGWGHTAFGRSSCITDHVVRYFLDGVLPPEGTVCPANPNPFLPEVAEPTLGSDPAEPRLRPAAWLSAARASASRRP